MKSMVSKYLKKNQNTGNVSVSHWYTYNKSNKLKCLLHQLFGNIYMYIYCK